MGILNNGTKTVTTAGVAERLTELQFGVVGQLTIESLTSNTGDVYYGDRSVSSTKGGTLPTPVSSIGAIKIFRNQDPREVWLDVAVSGNGVKWIAEE